MPAALPFVLTLGLQPHRAGFVECLDAGYMREWEKGSSSGCSFENQKTKAFLGDTVPEILASGLLHPPPFLGCLQRACNECLL